MIAALQACPDRLFQIRLASHLGRGDINNLIDSMTANELQEWRAISIIDGWDHGWKQTAEIIAGMNNNTNRCLSAQGVDPDKLEWLSGQDVIDTFDRKKKLNTSNLQSVETRLANKVAQQKAHGI